MVVSIENQKVALASITLLLNARSVVERSLFTSKERLIFFNSSTILFNGAEVATSVEDLVINFEIYKSAESISESKSYYPIQSQKSYYYLKFLT